MASNEQKGDSVPAVAPYHRSAPRGRV